MNRGPSNIFDSEAFMSDDFGFRSGSPNTFGDILMPAMAANVSVFETMPHSNDVIGFDPLPESPTAEYDQTQILGHGSILTPFDEIPVNKNAQR